MIHKKSSINPPDGGDQKVLVNVKEASYSLMIGSLTEAWDDPPYPGLMF